MTGVSAPTGVRRARELVLLTPSAQERVWEFAAKGLVNLHQPQTGEWERMRELMRQYAKTPMDLADASLVSAAERLGLSRIFTFDGHFYAYRIHGTDTFDVIPG